MDRCTIFLHRFCFCCAEPGTPQAPDRGLPRERGDLLPRAGQHLLGSELPQSQSLVHPADAGPEGRLRHRTQRRPPAHRDHSHPDQPTQTGERRQFYLIVEILQSHL